jgi:hypothetical protein
MGVAGTIVAPPPHKMVILLPLRRPLNFCPSCHCEARSGEAILWFIEWL